MDPNVSTFDTNLSPEHLTLPPQNRRKLFPIILLLTFIIIIFGLLFIIYQLQNSKKISRTIDITPSPTFKIQKPDDHEGSNTYSNSLFGFSFKYPKDVKLFADQRGDDLTLALDPDETQFASLQTIASASSKMNDAVIQNSPDLDELKDELINNLTNIFDPNIYGPFIEIEVGKRYLSYKEHAFDDLNGDQKTLIVNNNQALQKSGNIVLLKESTISPQIIRNRTVTVFFRDKYAYKFIYTSHPQRADFYPIYQDIVNSFDFRQRLPTPTFPYNGINLSVLNPRPKFPLDSLRNWGNLLRLTEEKALLWTSDARLHRVEVDISRNNSESTKFTFHYVSNSQSQLTSFRVGSDQHIEQEQYVTISDPEVLDTLNRQSPNASPYNSILRALRVISPNDEQIIDNISSILDNYERNPASFNMEPLSFTGWLVAAYKRGISEPIRVLVDSKTGNVFYKE